jgi:hypothetical protein
MCAGTCFVFGPEIAESIAHCALGCCPGAESNRSPLWSLSSNYFYRFWQKLSPLTLKRTMSTDLILDFDIVAFFSLESELFCIALAAILFLDYIGTTASLQELHNLLSPPNTIRMRKSKGTGYVSAYHPESCPGVST